MEAISDQDIAVLDTGIWFKNLAPELRQALLAMARRVSLQSGEALFLRGDERDGLYAVLEGMVRVSGLNEEGKEAILTFVEAPSWIGEVALFDGEERTHDAIADGEVRLLHFSQDALDQLLEAFPQYWREFGLLLSQKLRLAFTALEELALLPAPIRLGRRLVMIAEGYGIQTGESRLVVSVPQESLGRMLSISRQTTNQILKDLARKDLIKLSYGHIEITDLEGLKRFCSE